MVSMKWKPLPATTAPRAINPKGLHRHGCVRCSATYEDNCLSPGVNRDCSQCRYEREQPIWELNLIPIECCFTESHEATSQERVRYALAGESPWWICGKCKRPMIYRPNKNVKVK